MKKGKTVLKLRPDGYIATGEFESWLSDMRASGLKLISIGVIFARFEKAEPRNMRYRVEVSGKAGISEEQKELYKEAGWDYFARYQGIYHVFSSPEERKATEIHTDLSTQAETLKALDKKIKISSAISLLLICLGLALILHTIFFYNTPILNLMKNQSLAILPLVYILVIFTDLRRSAKIIKIRKNLINGIAVNHRANWRKEKYYKIGISIIALLLFISIFAIPIGEIKNFSLIPLTVSTKELPILRLAEIEDNPKLEILVSPAKGYWKEDIDYYNYYSCEPNFLAPKHYESHEHLIIKDQTWYAGGGEYSPSLVFNMYELRFKPLASPLFDELEKVHYEEGKYSLDMDYPYFDRLALKYDTGDSKQVFALKNEIVIYLSYHGKKDFEDILPALEKMIEKEVNK